MWEEIFKIKINKEDPVPVYKQLAEGIGGLITRGALSADSKLPPIRKMAEHFNINAATIVSAYKLLENKKLAYSRQGSGTFVSPLPVKEIPEPVATGNIHLFDNELSVDNAINFTITSLPDELFPVDAFKSAFNSVLEREKGGAFRYMDSMGYPPLRKQLCDYLEDLGIKTSADNIQIISGAQQGIDVISKAMLKYGDTVFVETPTFYGAAGAFLSRGARLIEIPLDTDGMELNILEDYLKLYHPKFIYMMAYFQTPTGVSYSTEKKRRLLELAEHYDTYIIEEDDFYDFYYGKEKPTPLKALDYKNRVIYIKSFSKILMPGLRMGLMVLPKKIQQEVARAKYTTDISTSGFIQKAMEVYIQENGWENHGNIMRRFGSAQYRLTLSLVKKYLGENVRFLPPNGGVSLWLELPDGISARTLCTRMLEKNVILTPGSQFSLNGLDNSFIRLSFSGLDEAKLSVGLKRIGETVNLLLSKK